MVKNQNQVRRLIEPRVYICDECIELCSEIIADEFEDNIQLDVNTLPKPAEIKSYLDQYVIGQDDAKVFSCSVIIIICELIATIMIVIRITKVIFYY